MVANNTRITEFFSPKPPSIRLQTKSKRRLQHDTLKSTGPSSYLDEDLHSPETSPNDQTSRVVSGRETRSTTNAGRKLPATSSIALNAQRLEGPIDSSIAPLSAKVTSSIPTNQLVIANSDSDDSDSSLEDMADILQGNSSISKVNTSMYSNSFNKGGRQEVSHSPNQVKSKYRFDLKSLVELARKDDAIQASIERVRGLVQKQEQADKSKLSYSQVIESVITDKDTSDTAKVMKAVERTEATHMDEKWCFFDDISHGIDGHHQDETERLIFPKDQATGIFKMLGSPVLREQAILSGFAEDLVGLGHPLPDDIFLWVLHQVYLTSHQDMRASHGRLSLSCPPQIERLVKREYIDNVFRMLGCRSEAVDLDAHISMSSVSRGYHDRDWTRLRIAIEFLGQLAVHVSAESASHCLKLLLRLCADSIIQEKTCLLVVMQEALRQLISGFSASAWTKYCQEICGSVFTTTRATLLRLYILRCVPSTDVRLHDLRRRLALAFFLDDSTCLVRSARESINISTFTNALSSTRFRIWGATDYAQLSALISFLDIAIDDGRNHSLNPMRQETEAEFNAEVDLLCARLKAIHGNIHDSGAKYISRIDAKEVLEGVQNRLLHTVRSRPKPKHSVFGLFGVENDTDIKQTERQSDFMSKMFKKVTPTSND